MSNRENRIYFLEKELENPKNMNPMIMAKKRENLARYKNMNDAEYDAAMEAAWKATSAHLISEIK